MIRSMVPREDEMKKILICVAALAMVAVAMPALAGNGGNGNGAPNGAHYNLNIIGSTSKNPPMTGSNRHTIFVALGDKKNDISVSTDIWLTPGPFEVCDGNGFDLAYDCFGNTIHSNSNGAVFQLPCNTLIETDYGCDGGKAHEDYTVWARAVGTPGGSATITTCAYDTYDDALVCNTGNDIASFSRGSGKVATFQDVTSQLTTIDACFKDAGGSIVCGTVSLFNNILYDYFWDYDNLGLRNLQVRFYPQ
jgi:hypothetical protein